jgi:serine/threonine protein kinase
VPAIVQVFDFLEANGTAYIVMELLSGATLEDRINTGDRLKPEEVDRILWPLLDGLEQVHAAGFLHRDIKPANILLDAAGNPTLIDFGASRAAMVGRTAAMTAIITPSPARRRPMPSIACWTIATSRSARPRPRASRRAFWPESMPV